MSTESRIKRIALVSPVESELRKRGFSKIMITVENESAIDTLMNASVRPMQGYIDVSRRAIEYCLMQNVDYGEITPTYLNDAGNNGAYLETSSWLTNENGDVFDMIISLDSRFEPEYDGLDLVTILRTDKPTVLENAPQGERPLVLIADIEDLTMGIDDDQRDQNAIDQNENRQSGQDGGDVLGRGAVLDPEHDKRLKENGGGDQGQGQVTDPEHDGRLKGNEGDHAHSEEEREPVAARQPGADEPRGGGRGRVVNPEIDRRTRRNRAPTAARRNTTGDDDRPNGGGAGGSAGSGGAAGGRGRQGAQGGRGSGARGEGSTWQDGRPRTVSAFLKDGVTPRKKPGPQIGAKYRPRVGMGRRQAA